jgi:predicted DNA-binding protein YlxM (UPF0122 family)
MGARMNPYPRQHIVTGNKQQISDYIKKTTEDYRFYARVLRAIYSKPKLRNKIINLMKDIEDTGYLCVPEPR